MTISVLFVQGAGEGAHDRWDRKLFASLKRELGKGYRVHYPRMPEEGEPRYRVWKDALLEQLERLEPGAILVGHSVGGTVLVHALAEERPRAKLRAIVLIAAPFIGDGGWPSDDIPARVDFAERLPVGVPVFVFHGTKDPIVPFGHASLYAAAIPQAVLRALANRDHQLDGELREVARDLRSLASQAPSAPKASRR